MTYFNQFKSLEDLASYLLRYPYYGSLETSGKTWTVALVNTSVTLFNKNEFIKEYELDRLPECVKFKVCTKLEHIKNENIFCYHVLDNEYLQLIETLENHREIKGE